jgi:cysteine sulfinate desulfinase/cysteine desulfurase-like protein
VFTSGGSEANNAALKGAFYALPGRSCFERSRASSHADLQRADAATSW